MKILYGFNSCSYKKYNELFNSTSVMILQQAQKYHSLMTTGLAANGAEVQCISGLPINRKFDKSSYIHGGNDEENGVRFHYFGSINFLGFRQLTISIKAFFYTLFTHHDDVAVCDILDLSISVGMKLACKIRRIPLIGIVTDVPGKLSTSGKKGIPEYIDEFFMQRMDGYVLLTEPMNEIVNPKHRPYIVIEGQVDCKMDTCENKQSEKRFPKVMLYAGSIKKIYGISKLTEAFVAINEPDWELHIYGDGDYKGELLEICHMHPNVKYMGIQLNREIVNAEIKASLLVNPRPTGAEYTKYSFPSKNMEYMVSGTPVLTTILPGMPKEYYPFVYLIEDESESGIRKSLSELFAKSPEELQKLGMEAKEFVLENKNNYLQAEKVIGLAREVRRMGQGKMN